jgi:hypothetical protein
LAGWINAAAPRPGSAEAASTAEPLSGSGTPAPPAHGSGVSAGTAGDEPQPAQAGVVWPCPPCDAEFAVECGGGLGVGVAGSGLLNGDLVGGDFKPLGAGPPLANRQS